MKKLMTAVLAVCPKVRGSASDLRQVDVRSRHCAQCPPQPYRRNGQEETGLYFETALNSARAWSILVACVRRHGGGSHRFALASKRFVGLVAEHSA